MHILPLEREAKILAYLNEHGSLKVETLAQILSVSEMTVRRDLQRCDKKGLLRRCHGGAMPCNENEQEEHYENKKVAKQAQKRAIAECCASMVPEGATVFFDTGTTTYKIAELVHRTPGLTAVTADIAIADMLYKRGVRLLLVGGQVQQETGCMLGPFAEQMLRGLHADIAFMGAASISSRLEVMTPTVEKAFFKRLITERCAKSYLAADSTKFDRQAMYRINSLADYTGVVTDRVFSPEEQKIIKSRQMNIISVAKEE